MKFGYVALFVCLAVALSGCFGPTIGGLEPPAYGMSAARPSNQWVPHCKGGYDRCGRDGIVQRQTGTIAY